MTWHDAGTGFYGFYDEFGFNPLKNFVKKNFNKDIHIQQDALKEINTANDFEDNKEEFNFEKGDSAPF